MAQQQSAPPRGIMVESARENAQIIAAARQVIQQWRRYKQTGRLTVDRGKLVEDARFVIQTVRYSIRLWMAEGAWTAYFQVSNGAVHNCIACRTIDPVYTHFQPILELTGLAVEEVVARGFKMCLHCLNRPNDQTAERVERMVGRLCVELEAVVDALK